MINRSAVHVGGKLPAKHDLRTIQARSVISVQDVMVPNRQDWHLHGPEHWGMMANDRVGCCTVAGMGHLLQQWTVNASGMILTPSDEAILEGYAAISDYPDRDVGAYCLDALNWARRVGLLCPDGRRHPILAYAKIDPHDHAMVRAAAVVCGGLYIGATLHSGIWGSEVWDAPKPSERVEGGHAMAIGYVDGNILRPIGWDVPQAVTWAWWDAEVDECYCLISDDAFAEGRSVIGLDLDATLQQVQRITE